MYYKLLITHLVMGSQQVTSNFAHFRYCSDCGHNY